MKKIELGKTGEMIPIIGQGTWGIKSFKGREYYENWKKSLRRGIELGMTHIDTAEFYGHGTSEKVVGEIISEYNRDELFITSKLFPMHLSYNSMKKAANKSLTRLGIEYFDLYLIHWPSPFISIKKQMNVMEDLVGEGKTRYIGVSNFSVKQFKEAQQYLKETKLVTNQLLANISKQDHIHNSLPYYCENNVILTAYSPLGHRGFNSLKKDDLIEKLQKVAKNHNAAIQQIAIAWLINHENVITIPKAFKVEHVESNAKAAEIMLTKEEVEVLDRI
ncbi:MAG: aldo/keto reductase [Candidatus Lokiarchaeota archaeon]|nr:aldo/keto reductase [Candidatus Lokiarchaeota archaeon]